jgi:oxygen-independent coproporphyrinogen-3 oxidase
LKLLGRIHTWEDVLESCDILRKAGFRNLNLDLMSGLPGQTLEQWQDTLHGAVALHPEHISAYSLIVEEGTPFYQKYGEDERCRQAGEDTRYLPDEETERQMYQWTCSYLKEHGFVQYEISNYAKPGRECRHNIGYWTGAEYLGLGLGSASLFGGKRFSNTRELSEYLAGDFEPREVEVLSRTAQMEEFVFLGLRMCQGISRAEFAARFGVELEAVYGQELAQLCSQGLLKQEAGFVALTREGVSVSNYVMAKFIK